MAGFKVPGQGRTVMVSFPEDSEYHGAEIECRKDLFLEEMVQIQDMAQFEDLEGLGPEQIGRVRDLYTMLREKIRHFGDTVVVSWNLLGETDEALEVSGESLLDCGEAFGTALMNQYIAEVAMVAGPLGLQSKSGPRWEPGPEGETTAAG